MIKANIHIVHPNPTQGMRRLTIIGKMTPPIKELEVVKLYTVALYTFYYIAKVLRQLYITVLALTVLQIA
jgi:hypothetical protein